MPLFIHFVRLLNRWDIRLLNKIKNKTLINVIVHANDKHSIQTLFSTPLWRYSV